MSGPPEYFDNGISDLLEGEQFANETNSNYFHAYNVVRTDRIGNLTTTGVLSLQNNDYSIMNIGSTSVYIGITNNQHGNLSVLGSVSLYKNITPIVPLNTNNVLFMSVTNNGLLSVDSNSKITTYQPLKVPGDIASYNSVLDTQARIPVGTSNQVLTPDPTSPFGIVWKNFGTIQATLGSYNYIGTTSVLTTTSSNYIDYLTLGVPLVPQGTYYIGWEYTISQSSLYKGADVRILLDGNDTLNEVNIPYQNQNEIDTRSSFITKIFSVAVLHTIKIQVKAVANTNTRLTDGRIVFWNVQ